MLRAAGQTNVSDISGLRYRPIDQNRNLVGNKLVHVNGGRFHSTIWM